MPINNLQPNQDQMNGVSAEMMMQPSFADLAGEKFMVSFPELSNLIVNFQDMSDEIGNISDVKVGVFILRSGMEIFYVPVISKADNIGPIDSFYIASTGKFFPLTQKTLSTIFNAQQYSLGKSTVIPPTVPVNPSIYHMVTPPRTGKYVYASANRLTEMLYSLPPRVKEAMLVFVTGNKPLAEPLDALFGMQNLLSPLISKTNTVPQGSPIEIVTEGEGLSEGEVSSILSKGYAVRGKQAGNRIALSDEEINKSNVFFEITVADTGKVFEVVKTDGTTVRTWFPEFAIKDEANGTIVTAINHRGRLIGLTEMGEYIVADKLIGAGKELSPKEFLRTFTEVISAPMLIKNLEGVETFGLFDSTLKLTGIYTADGPVAISNLGASVRVCDEINYDRYKIEAFHNFTTHAYKANGVMFVPHGSPIFRIKGRCLDSFCPNINAASRAVAANDKALLGDTMSVAYDGHSYIMNGRVVGQIANAMKELVEKESLPVATAETFIKQAQERGQCTIYMTKKADMVGNIPSYGTPLADSDEQATWGKNALGPGSRQAVFDAAQTNDAQITEAAIISELLQVPDMFEQIAEYTPDIEEAVDKLGRALFLTRVNVNVLADNIAPDQVMTFMSSIKNVFRNLGETLIKLQQLSANVQRIQ